MHRSPALRIELAVGAVFVMTASIASCRYFESLDQFTEGEGGLGGFGASGIGGSSGGTGGTNDGGGGTGGSGGTLDGGDEDVTSTVCQSGTCTAPCEDCDNDLITNGCETDTSTDSNHCGGCDISCYGGQCQARSCLEHQLASGLTVPWGIVADESGVYWVAEGTSGNGTVSKVSTTGGTPETLASAQPSPILIDDDTQYVYWANFSSGGSIHRVTKAGTGSGLLTNANGPRGLAIFQQSLYYARTDGSIYKIPKAGGSAAAIITGQSGPRNIVADGSGIYWVNTTGGEVRGADHEGTGISTLASTQTNPIALSVDATHVYWTNAGTYATAVCTAADGEIWRTLKDGSGTADLLTDGQACPLGIVVDGDDVYWTNTGTSSPGYDNNGAVMRMASDGTGSPTPVAAGQVKPFGVAVNSHSVYWTNQGIGATGSVVTLPKSEITSP